MANKDFWEAQKKRWLEFLQHIDKQLAEPGHTENFKIAFAKLKDSALNGLAKAQQQIDKLEKDMD